MKNEPQNEIVREISILNTRLARLNINYLDVFKSVLKKKRKTATIASLGFSTVGMLASKDRILLGFIGGIILSLPLWINYLKTSRLESFTDECNKLIIDYLNKPGFMWRLLKKLGKSYNVEEIAGIDISTARTEDFEVLEKFILKYKAKRQLSFLVTTSLVLGTILTGVFKPISNDLFSLVNNITLVGILEICMYYVLVTFSNVTYKIIFKKFAKVTTKYYEIGALSGYHYKLLNLYYSNYTLEGVFGIDDYEYFIEEDVIDRDEMVTDYIADCNYKRTRGIIALGIIIGLGITYLSTPVYLVAPLLIGVILTFILKIKINENTLNKYEDLLVQDKADLTCKIMKYLDEDFLSNF